MGTMTDDPASLLAKEWLVTNGIGGYASSSLLGIATRRYHGLFVPDLPGRGRTLLVPRLDDTVEWERQTVLLSGAEYADGRIEHDGVSYLKGIRREWQTPVWRFDLGGSLLEKRIVAPYGQNTVYVQYRCLSGSLRVHLRPFVTYRMHDARLGEGHAEVFPVTLSKGRCEIPLPQGAPSLKLCVRPRQGVFVAADVISEQVSYRVDRDRGSDHVQDLFSPGFFTVDLSKGQHAALVASVEPWDRLSLDSTDILQAEQQRLEKLVSLAPALQKDQFAQQLQLAADQFIVQPGARPEEQTLARASGEEAKTIIAGYHWFGDWGRDTMISLEGLTLCT
ncbi:MAG TPA: glycogen debranching enzyme N-terminal domain-containing protein, partial [Nitrospira sp.]|nr:glycogen debranching enzyme N-terminal domain-containing protein [Nitrospira sp.]